MTIDGVSVLIIDDDINLVRQVGEYLQPDFDVSFATTAYDGLELAKTQPEVILLDVNLAEVNGFELCRSLKSNKETADIPVIFITSATTLEDQTEAFNVGAVDFVHKPLELPILKMRIMTHAKLFRQSKMFDRMSQTDSLTELYNRRKFSEDMTQELYRSQRNQQGFCLILIDVDDFKAFNDNYGHAEGDKCLQYVARVLKENGSRAIDGTYRIGGEEFAILLPETALEGAQTVCQNILQQLKTDCIVHEHASNADYVTVSMGIAMYSFDNKETMEQLFKRCDDALYKAKQQGKNQYLTAD